MGTPQVCGKELEGLGVPNMARRRHQAKTRFLVTNPKFQGAVTEDLLTILTPVEWLCADINISEKVISAAKLIVFNLKFAPAPPSTLPSQANHRSDTETDLEEEEET